MVIHLFWNSWGHFLQPGLSQLQYLPSKDSGLAVPSKKGDHEKQGEQPSTHCKTTPLGSRSILYFLSSTYVTLYNALSKN